MRVMASSSSVLVGPFAFYGLSETELKALAGAPDDDRDGSMIALYPDPAVASRLALEGGLAPEELHVTIGYTGKAANVHRGALMLVAERVAAVTPVVHASVSGYARFCGPEQDVLVALIDGPDIEDLRARFRVAAAEASIDFPRDHGFTAHMTIGYLGHDDDVPILRLEPVELEFDTLFAVHADSSIGFEFITGGVVGKSAQPGALPIEAGTWVKLGQHVVGRVDLVVTTGTVPGARAVNGEEVEATDSSPAARVVVYELGDGGAYKVAGRKIAASTATLERTAPLRTRQAKSAEAGIAASVSTFTEAFPDLPLPTVGAMTTAYLRGKAAWPGEAKTLLTADEWALGRVDALLATCAGLRPNSYIRDDDLLPDEAKYSPNQPRDSHGRWVRIGAYVKIAKLAGGGTGTVDKYLGQRRFQVNKGSDDAPNRVNVHGRYLTVQKNPDGSAPSAGGAAPKDPVSKPSADARNVSVPGSASGELGTEQASKPSAPAPLNDEQYAAHTKNIEDTIGSAIKSGQTTDKMFGAGTDATGRAVYTPERAAAHREIVAEMLGAAKDVPNEGKAVMAGGLGGAGKSTVLKGPANVDQSQFMTLNPDDVKEKMAERGMIPDVEGLSPMEASALVHEESSHITMLAAEAAYAQNKNVIWDITMASQGSVSKRLDDLAANGYTDTKAVFVDIPVEKSVERALSRHKRGMEAHRAGKGPGGRYVPPALIRANAPSGSTGAMSKNRETFDAVRDRFGSWAVYDNSGSAPSLVASSGER